MDIKIEYHDSGLREALFQDNSNKTLGFDGVVHIETGLTQKAFDLLKKAGYSGDTIILNLGRAADKYKSPVQLPKVNYNWDSAESLIKAYPICI